MAWRLCFASRNVCRGVKRFPAPAYIEVNVSGLFRLNFLNGRSLLQSGRNDDDSRPFGSWGDLTIMAGGDMSGFWAFYDWF